MAKIVILGAGLTGLSLAYHLKGEYEVYEKNAEIGGLCRSKYIDGFIFDYSGHLLHFQTQKGFNFIKELLPDNLVKHKRRAWIYFQKTYVPYPFQANLYYLPQELTHECIQGVLKRKNFSEEEPANFLEWCLNKFGKGIVEHFLKPYNVKFWTVPLEEIDCSWVENLVPVPTISEVLEGAWRRSKKSFGYNVNFWYPQKGGIKNLIDSLNKNINHVYLGKEVKSVNWKEKTVIFTDESKVGYECLFSTIPLIELMKNLDEKPEDMVEAAKLLNYISVYNLNLGIDRDRITDKHWIYFPEDEFIFFRLGFPMNFSKDVVPKGKSSLYAEVSYSSNRPVDKEKLKTRIIEDLYKTQILKPKDKILVTDENDFKYAYILSDHNYQNSQKKILDFLNSVQIFPVGRYGRWSYMSMEESILDGEKASQLAKAYTL